MKGALTVLAVVVLVAGLYFAFPQVGVSRFIGERLGNLATLNEGSAREHYTSVVIAEDEISRFEPVEYLLGTFQSRKDLILPKPTTSELSSFVGPSVFWSFCRSSA